MDIILISMLSPLVPLAFLLCYAIHPVNGPDCGETLSLFLSPFK